MDINDPPTPGSFAERKVLDNLSLIILTNESPILWQIFKIWYQDHPLKNPRSRSISLANLNNSSKITLEE